MSDATATTAQLQIISGGQTGADIGALRGAHACGYRTGGYMPLGFRIESGQLDTTLVQLYRLQAAPTESYSDRDKLNVDMCDALLAIRTTLPKTGRGTECTVNNALYGKHEHVPLHMPQHEEDPSAYELITPSGKPVLVLWNIERRTNEHAQRVASFLYRKNVRTLMVNGPCASTVDSIEAHTSALIEQALTKYTTLVSALQQQ
jgi:hypothetical protein